MIHLAREAPLGWSQSREISWAVCRRIAVPVHEGSLNPDGRADDFEPETILVIRQSRLQDDGIRMALFILGCGLPARKELGGAFSLAFRGVPVRIHGYPNRFFDLAAKGFAHAVVNLSEVIRAIDWSDEYIDRHCG